MTFLFPRVPAPTFDALLEMSRMGKFDVRLYAE